jgi:hypothetical protein
MSQTEHFSLTKTNELLLLVLAGIIRWSLCPNEWNNKDLPKILAAQPIYICMWHQPEIESTFSTEPQLKPEVSYYIAQIKQDT